MSAVYRNQVYIIFNDIRQVFLFFIFPPGYDKHAKSIKRCVGRTIQYYKDGENFGKTILYDNYYFFGETGGIEMQFSKTIADRMLIF